MILRRASRSRAGAGPGGCHSAPATDGAAGGASRGRWVPEPGAGDVVGPVVSLHPEAGLVVKLRAGPWLDLGAIGKGYAVEKAADLLRELGVTSALIHGGTSTIYAIGRPPDQEAWKVTLELPVGWARNAPDPDGGPALLAVVALRDGSYVVFLEDDYKAKSVMMRWKPE